MLAIPEKVLALIPPRPQGYPQTRDLFPGYSGYPFDPLGAAETAANITLERALHPERAQRLVEYGARRGDAPGLAEVIEELFEATWKAFHEDGYHGEVQNVADNVLLYNLMKLAIDEKASARVRGISSVKLWELMEWLEREAGSICDSGRRAHFLYAADQIRVFKENPDKVRLMKPLETPMGPPI